MATRSKMYAAVKEKPIKKPKSIQERVKEARNDLAERVSIAGFKEAFEEKIRWIRFIFQIAVSIFAFCSIYGVYQVIVEWMKSGYIDEINDITNRESLPFSNVTVFAQVYLNESFIKENIIIPSKLASLFTKETGQTINELYRQLTLYLAFTSRPRHFSSTILKYFSKILRHNPQTIDLSQFLKAAMPTCQTMLKNCHFNGRPFDCCEKAVQSLDEDRLCYILALNFDSDNAASSNLTTSQTKLGPRGGLTIDAHVPTKDIPWMEEDASNGFNIYVNAVPFSFMQSPMTAPHGSETFIRIKAAKHILTENCAPPNHLSINADPTFYHDPEGFTCMITAFMATFQNLIPCHAPHLTYFPNQTNVCHPISICLATLVLSTSNLEEEFNRWFSVDTKYDANAHIADGKQIIGHMNTGGLTARLVGNFGQQREKLIEYLETTWKAAMTNKARCLTHCKRWEYSSTASFIDLEMNDVAYGKSIMFSRIHVFDGDFEYRQYEEVKEISAYLAFCNFGNIVGFYLGMSMVSFFHLGYVFRFWYLKKRSLRGKRWRRIRNVRVGPTFVTTAV